MYQMTGGIVLYIHISHDKKSSFIDYKTNSFCTVLNITIVVFSKLLKNKMMMN